MVEPFQNKLSVLFILGKNNGLANPVTAGHMDGVEHGGIGGKDNPRVFILAIGQQIAQRQMGQIILEAVRVLPVPVAITSRFLRWP